MRAQEEAISTKLNEIFSMVPLDCKKNTNRSDENTCTCNFYGKQLKIRMVYNDGGKLSHIGLKLFTLDKNLAYNSEILFFIERTFLEYLLLHDNSLIKKRAVEENIELWMNGNELGRSGFSSIMDITCIVDEDFEFSITHDSLTYFAEFVQSFASIRMKFPANSQVISGMDKKEYGEQIASTLKHYKAEDYIVPYIPDMASLLPYKDSIFVSSGDTYFKAISSNKYFILNTDDGLKPLFSIIFPMESFTNCFLIPACEKKTILLKIDHKIYGNYNLAYELNLINFLSFFKKDFEFYFGIEENSDDILSGTLILFNRRLNFINLLYVEADKKVLFGNLPVIKGRFYTDIPSGNIRDLYGEHHSIH